MTSVSKWIATDGDYHERVEDAKEACKVLSTYIDYKRREGVAEIVVAPSMSNSFRGIVQTMGLGNLKPNIVILRDGGLMLLLSQLFLTKESFESCKIQVFCIAEEDSDAEELKANVRKYLVSSRVNCNFNEIVGCQSGTTR
ncbi:Uncharacterized protein Adt_35473 [Abeliophyllum distichum]|uniref:SLC12A transporter C-terminal domain-containing protein n=1 Tax=Abeliophyllum distichum TaxID=126358 RepID=A0ABD1QET7_9LAMI